MGDIMKDLGYYNGQIDLIENIKVPMCDRACYFGDGIYDVTYSRNHIPYCLDAHLDRFYCSAEQMELNVPLSKEELRRLLCDLIKRVDDGEQNVYWQISRGTGYRNHGFTGEKANLWIMLRPMAVKDTKKPLRVITVEDTRSLHCDIKSLNLIPNIMAQNQAEKAGCDTAILHRGNRVTECVHANVQILKNGVLITPPADNLMLAGVGRENLIKAAQLLGIGVEIRPFTLDELMSADEVVLSSSGSFCIPIIEVDGTACGGGDGKTLELLQDALIKDYIEKTTK